jgi:subtilisin-like proprotein convertase family protein
MYLLLVTESMLSGYALHTMEYVHISVSLSHSRRGDVELVLVCPSGTSSVIAATRKYDDR